ncbi:helix-turn-helix domain-containing protein [Novosphingobium sp. HII-3]|uniref:helix-turn-helix domain-containing protein n=1 Tax=Novosphingobium sp. HII-3 TaxID=2075565 RepID=UPI001E37D369|nr:helix-turn-helix domain-containing protein [Novosphingobium sp. HII-3]
MTKTVQLSLRLVGPDDQIDALQIDREKNVETLEKFSDFLQFSLLLAPLSAAGYVMPIEILTMREVADFLKINEKTAYKLTAAGKLPGFKVGGSWRFKRADIESWIEKRVNEGHGGRAACDD